VKPFRSIVICGAPTTIPSPLQTRSFASTAFRVTVVWQVVIVIDPLPWASGAIPTSTLATRAEHDPTEGHLSLPFLDWVGYS
jgi:hypothetical protein